MCTRIVQHRARHLVGEDRRRPLHGLAAGLCRDTPGQLLPPAGRALLAAPQSNRLQPPDDFFLVRDPPREPPPPLERRARVDEPRRPRLPPRAAPRARSPHAPRPPRPPCGASPRRWPPRPPSAPAGRRGARAGRGGLAAPVLLLELARLAGERRVGLPPVDSHLLSALDGRDQQAQLDRQQLDVEQADLDVSGDDDSLVEDPLENVREVGRPTRALEVGAHRRLASRRLRTAYSGREAMSQSSPASER